MSPEFPKSTVEPVFGIIKHVIGFRQFLLRGLKAVQGEWTFVCSAFNLKRLHTLKRGKKGCRSGSEYVVECA
jgi:DDE family transposase